MSEQITTSNSESLPQWLVATINWHFLAISSVTFLVELIFRRSEGVFGLRGGPHLFFSIEWARDYAAGFHRRSLIGEILRIVHLDPTDYLIITVGAWITSLALYTALIAATWKLLCGLRTPVRIALFTAVILSPATTGLIIETAGDPLQLLLVIYFSLIWLFFRVPMSPAITTTLFATFGATSVMVHEAIIFFTVPSTLVLAAYKRTPLAYVTLLSHVVASAAALALVMIAVEKWSGAPSLPSIHFGGKSIAYPGPILDAREAMWYSEYFGSKFSELLAIQIKRLFQSDVQGYLNWISILFGSLLLPVFFVHLLMFPDRPARHLSAWNRRARASFLLFVVIVTPTFLSTHAAVRYVSYLTHFAFLPLFLVYLVGSNCLSRSLSRRPCVCVIFVVIVLLSTPLYLIAHDWARFLSYSLFCTIVLYARLSHETDKIELANSSTTWPTIGTGLVLAGLTVSPTLSEYRFLGLFASSEIFITTSLMIALAFLAGYITDKACTLESSK